MEHFKAIAAVTDRPIVVYNIPGRVVLNLEPETIAELAEIPNVQAVKQANDDLEQARRIVELGLDLYAGDDDLVLPFLELGGARRRLRAHARRRASGEGARPPLARRRARGRARARRELAPSIELLRVVTNPIAIKAALNLLGHEVGGHRLPLVEADGRRARRCPRLPRAARPAHTRSGLAETYTHSR